MATVSIFGHTCTVNAVTTLKSGSPLVAPESIAFDSAGNLYAGNGGSAVLSIMPAATGTVFGVSCTINTLKTLWSTGLSIPQGVCTDSAGNLYIADSGNAKIFVLPKATGTIFGHSVTVNTLYTLSTVTGPITVDMDSAGNLWVLSNNGIQYLLSVIPVSSGTLFGVGVTANTLCTILSSGMSYPNDLCFDSAGNISISDYSASCVYVLPKATGTILGVPFTAKIGRAHV